ncbi:hypothetical protein [Methylocapsa acidiphila]|uniref:hypothetical protein n=1 Tax=Methylocapsa acidiphila TaxID=133552 RepID=UPI0012EB57F6|nr:hypothetical protein [Methylocapsa acidiphila]
MSYLVFALGLALSVCGAAAVSFGYGIVNVERGWSSVIAGATALSCGIVTIALGFILQALTRLRLFLEQAALEAAPLPLPQEQVAAAIRPLDEAAPQPREAQPSQALPSEAPPSQEPPLERGERRGASLAPPPAAASPEPRIADAKNASPLPPPRVVEQIDVHRGRSRVPPPQPGEAVRDAATMSRASIEDVRRLVAAKVEAWPKSRPGPGQAVGAPSISGPAVVAGSPPGAPLRDPAARMGPSSSVAAGTREISGTSSSFAPGAPASTVAAAGAGEGPASFRAGLPTGTDVASGFGPSVGGDSRSRSGASRIASPPQGPDEMAEFETLSRELEEPDSPPTDQGLAIAGRYESEGTSYVMYADGSIDAQSERGVYHFKSMADLKAFMESQG